MAILNFGAVRQIFAEHLQEAAALDGRTPLTPDILKRINRDLHRKGFSYYSYGEYVKLGDLRTRLPWFSMTDLKGAVEFGEKAYRHHTPFCSVFIESDAASGLPFSVRKLSAISIRSITWNGADLILEYDADMTPNGLHAITKDYSNYADSYPLDDFLATMMRIRSVEEWQIGGEREVNLTPRTDFGWTIYQRVILPQAINFPQGLPFEDEIRKRLEKQKL